MATTNSELPLVPNKLWPVFDGSSGETCSVDYFRDFLPDSWGCEVGENQAYDLKIFRSQPPYSLIQRQVLGFLLSMEKFKANYWGLTALVQFWAPITTDDGRRVLTVSEQPFATRQYLKGLCRYRYYCLELCRNGDRTEVGKDFGPIGRVFSRGSLEFSPHVDVYSDIDFPLKNQAKHCGVAGYLALPVFELRNEDNDGQHQSCVGVLEFISLAKNVLSSSDTKLCMSNLKERGLAFRYPFHSRALTQVRPHFKFSSHKREPDEISYVLDLVRRAYGLPLIQVWLPCICNGSEVSISCEPNIDNFCEITHLVCGLKCLDRNERGSTWLSSHACCDSQVYFVENGKSWVGRANSLQRICFVKDIRKYSIVDYPLLTLGHFSDLLACFAVPLQLVNPKLPPLVLEVFLPTQYNFDTDQGAILRPLLSMVARELSKYNAGYGSRLYENCLIEISQSDVDYDCPCDQTPAMRTYVRCKKNSSCHGLRIVGEGSVQHQHHQATVPSHKSLVFGVKRKRSSRQRKTPGSNIHPTAQIVYIDTSDEEDYLGFGYNSEKREVPIVTGGSIGSSGPGNNDVVRGNGKISEPENDEIDRSTVSERNEVDHDCEMIVIARYQDDKVRFPFSSSSGIEGLRRELLKRFDLEVGRFKIKYPEDGDWIMLACSEDLSFHMRTLASSGKITFDLSVFSTT